MNKVAVFALICSFQLQNLFAQELPHPCGTPNHFTSWELAYQKHPEAFSRGADTILYVPITMHNVGSDAGASFVSMTRILDALCRINEDYKPTNIQFFLASDVKYIKNMAWNSHTKLEVGAEMMFQNNVKNTVNCYLNSIAAGNAGYNLPYAGISLLKSVVNASSHTWTHELGHAFTVQHPFIGWEGKIYNGDFYKNPAPEKVTYDYTLFKDSIILDTVIIDTAFVELVSGTNCAIAADKICDSKPDYLAFRWNCNAQGQSTQLEKDPEGVDFRSDGTLYMSYSDDACQNRFTTDQVARMRANILGPKKAYLYDQSVPNYITEKTTLSQPIDSQIVQYNNVKIKWQPTANATHYILQVSRFKNFDILDIDTIITSTSLDVTKLQVNRTYNWRVRPYNHKSFCTNFITNTFRTADLVRTFEIEQSDWLIYPNPVKAGQLIDVHYRNELDVNTLNLYNANGLFVQSMQKEGTTNRFIVPSNLSSGMYYLRFMAGDKVGLKKIAIID